MATIAAVLIVKNEAAVLERCLRSLGWVDEIVVVDDQSTDQTVAIAERYQARVFHRALDRFDVQRNYAIEQATAEWILSVDADEEIPDELAAEIRETIARPDAADVYGIPFWHRICGRWVRHGGWSMPLTRLYRRHVRWAGAVHEQVDKSTSYAVLRYPVLHWSHESIAAFLTKLNGYTDREAAARVAEARSTSPLKILLTTDRDFLRRYVFQSGWRDGGFGLILAMLMAFYVFVARAKAWELANPADEPRPEVEPRP